MPGLPTPLSTGWSANQDPEILNEIIQELVSSENAPASYVRTPPGTPHPDQQQYPGYVFLTQKTVGHDKVIRYWTTPEFVLEDVYNWEVDYVNDSASHPIFVRRYKTRRDQYAELARESTLTGLWKITVTNPGSQYDPQNPPTVTIGGPGSGASAVALVNVDGTISFVRITAEGTGYVTAPPVTISASGGVTAIATATIQSQSCKLIKQTCQNFPEDDPRFALFLIETRVFQTFPGPTITQWQFQERIEKLVRIDKQLILKSLVPADPNAESLDAGVIIEYQDLTAVYSAKITTTIPTDFTWDDGGEDNDFVYEAFMNHRWPDEVREDPVIIVAATLTGAPSYAIDYGWQCVVTEGYSGPCRAVVRERYTFDPTNQAFIDDLPTPTSIFPRADTIWVATNADVGGQARADVLSFVIPLTLHGPLTITSTATQYLPPGYQFRQNIAATVPPGFESGDSIVVVSEPQRVGIGKLWAVRIITIYHPARVATP